MIVFASRSPSRPTFPPAIFHRRRNDVPASLANVFPDHTYTIPSLFGLADVVIENPGLSANSRTHGKHLIVLGLSSPFFFLFRILYHTLLIFSNQMITHHPSNPHRLGHGPFRCRCLLKKKIFRTRVVRHSLNLVFDEKFFFHVRRSEPGFQVQLAVLDWDKLSANDLVGDATFEVKELIEGSPKPDGETKLYAADDEEEVWRRGCEYFGWSRQPTWGCEARYSV